MYPQQMFYATADDQDCECSLHNHPLMRKKNQKLARTLCCKKIRQLKEFPLIVAAELVLIS